MRRIFIAVVAGASLATVGCQAGGESVSLDTDDQKASYAIGLNVGGSLEQVSDHIDRAALRKGIEDALSGADPDLSSEEVEAVMRDFQTRMQEEMQREQAEMAETNRTEGESYLAENAQREGVETTASGLQYEVLRAGDGPSPGADDVVTLHYKGTLIDGTQFDSSYDRGAPATFSVNQVIPGFSEGLQLMEVGSQYRLYIPGDLGYGEQGSGPLIQPNATLIFEVELLEIAE